MPALRDLVGDDPAPRKVAGGFGFTEGPVFNRRGYLLFSDIPANRILRWERGSVSAFRENSNQANGLTFDHQGRLLACERGRVTRTEKDGRITVLAEAGLKMPNDLVYSIDGSIYFTDLPAGRVHQITRTGQVRVVSEECQAPNGVALAPDQLKLYVADSRQRNVRVYEVRGDGSLEGGRVFAEVRGDGLKTDEGGNVWVACEEGICVFDVSGKHLGAIRIPEQPSNLNWAEGFRGLYITARTSVYHLTTAVPGTRTY